ncbi:MAG: ABC transporter substrate-binding protein [Cyanobacteria bacterium SID2]|nr:ABC transporter substrate-binding protein [Cyanobacteria bacterium SID2]MBP0006817.1 ABC transporter substrate-binding protein [Cyanobacteria bacterium SBC]
MLFVSQFFRSWHRWFIICLASFILLGVGGCSIENFRAEAAQGTELIIGQLGDPKTFNAALSKEYPNVFLYTYEGLVGTNGFTAEVEPALAESWEISDDSLRIVFTLREGLKWSDGEPLTADDVIFTYNEIYFNEKIPSSTRDVLRVGESGAFPTVTKLDDRRVEFQLPEPFSPLLRSLSAEILPEHVLRPTIEQKDEKGNPIFNSTWGTDTDPKNAIVNGPYRLSQYIPSQRVIFERNSYYWRKDERSVPQPYIDRLIWQIVENQNTQLLQFRSGGLSAVAVRPQYFSLLKREEKRSNFTIYEDGPDFGTSFIAFNLNRGKNPNGTPVVDPIKSKWFNDLNFRKAVAHAIDRTTMINTIYRGLGELQHSPISIQSPYYYPPEKGLPTYEYDVEKAKQLLFASGFQYNDREQLLDADGNRVEFTLITNAGNQVREAMGAQIKQDLSQIGIKVNFTPIDFNKLVSQLSNSLDWECHLLGFTGGVEPHGGLTIWSPEGRLHNFNQNRKDPPLEGRQVEEWEREIERLFIQGSQEFDEELRKEIYGQAQTIVQENLPFIYLVNPFSMAAVRNEIQGVQYSALGGPFWNLYELSIEE